MRFEAAGREVHDDVASQLDFRFLDLCFFALLLGVSFSLLEEEEEGFDNGSDRGFSLKFHGSIPNGMNTC